MKTYHCIILSLALAATLLTSPTGYSASPEWTNNGVVWGGANPYSGYYRPGVSSGTNDAFDGLPNSATETAPVWTLSPGGTATLNASNNFLNITTSENQTHRYDQTNYWDASSAATVEFVLRINSMQIWNGTNATYAGSVLLGNSVEYYNPLFGMNTNNGYLTISGTTISNVIATDFNTIRITLDGMGDTNTSVARLYINNSTNAALTVMNLSAGAAPRLSFGDLSASYTQGGSIDWQSVAWISGQAIAPVPEPSAAVLALGGLGALALYYRCRRKNRVNI